MVGKRGGWAVWAGLVLAACSERGTDGGWQPELPAIDTQQRLDALASSLRLHLAVIENAPPDCPADAPFGVCHDAELTLENVGGPIAGRGWALYLTNPRRVLADSSAEFDFRHVNGGLHALEPTLAFNGFGAGESKRVRYQAGLCITAESDVMPRAYVAAPGLVPAVIENTDGEDPSTWLEPLTRPEQQLCGAYDPAVIVTPAARFEANAALRDLGADAVAAEIIPAPLSVERGDAALDLTRGLSLQASGLSEATLAEVNARMSQLDLAAGSDAYPVRVSVEPGNPAFAAQATAQAYSLRIDAQGVSIVGGDAAGAFYGLQSLFALVAPAGAPSRRLPLLDIPYDAPRYAYRGFQVDVARNFHEPPLMFALLRQMAAYKLDALHFHLSDDEGFRLEIPGLPELTGVGARRCHDDLAERECLLPQLGSGPFSDNSGSGWYTRAQFVELLALAAALQIEVVPEFDMPGHARSMIRAMALRAEDGDPSYLLSDPDDTSEYLSVQSYNDNVMNPCAESTYAFIAKLMDEVQAMYREAGAALKTWHMGGDEVPEGVWTRSPACDALVAAGGVPSTSELQAHFVERVNALAQERGIGVRGWYEGFTRSGADATPAFLDPVADLGGNTVSANWSAALQFFDGTLAPLADQGYGVVLNSADFLLFDHPYEADPKERGLSWATRASGARKVFSYVSGNIAANLQLLPECEVLPCAERLAGAAAITRTENVLGIEGELWGETLRTDEQLEYMAFPRLLSLAERGWHRAGWEPPDGMDMAAPIDRAALDADWERFANTLGHKELLELEQAGIAFRIDVPGARIVDGRLEANVATPGLGIEYRDEAGNFVPYDPAAPPALGATEVRAVTASGRAGRAVSVP